MNTPKINVTPLIDVLLVLLIIFMVVAPLKPSRFDAKVPAEPKPEPNVAANDRALVVTLDRENRLSLNNLRGLGTVDEPNALIGTLRSTFAERHENRFVDETGAVVKVVFIKAPKNVGYGSVVKVID